MRSLLIHPHATSVRLGVDRYSRSVPARFCPGAQHALRARFRSLIATHRGVSELASNVGTQV